MPQDNPEAYANMSSVEQMEAYTPDAHIRFRSLPQSQQYALLSHYTGTSNKSALSYAANMARNDPYMANRVLSMQASGSPETMQMRDNSIRDEDRFRAQSQTPSTSRQSQPTRGTTTGSTGANATGDGQVGATQAGAGRVSSPQTQQEPQGDMTVGDIAMQDEASGGIHRGIPMQSAQNAPIEDVPAGQEGTSDLQSDILNMLLVAGGGAMANQLGKELVGEYKMTRGENDVMDKLERGRAAQRGTGANIEDDIGNDIDVQDRIARRNFPQPAPRADLSNVPEPPIQVGRYTIDPTNLGIVDVQSNSIVPEAQQRELLQMLARYLREGDQSVLAAFGAQGQTLDSILSPDDHTRLQRLFNGEGPLGTTPIRTKKGKPPKYSGKTTARSASSLF